MNRLDIIKTFFKSNNLVLYKFLAITIVFIIGFTILYINNLREENKILNANLVLEKANNVSLMASINSQNEKIEENKIDYEKNLKELEDWKNKPPNIKYKAVIKFKEVKSNECKDIKNIINDIRTTSF